MKAGQFDELKLRDKAWLVQEFGSHILSIEYYDYRIHLFSFNSDFVELYYHIGRKRVEKIVIAKYGDLDKYLSRIVIGSIRKILL